MNEMTFPLLGALASSEKKPAKAKDKASAKDKSVSQEKTGDASVKLDEITKLLENDVIPLILKSGYSGSHALQSALRNAVADARVLSVLPKLAGPICVGIIANDDLGNLTGIFSQIFPDTQALAEYSLGMTKNYPWSSASDLPLLLLNSEGSTALKALDSREELANFSLVPGHPLNRPEDMTGQEYQTLLELPKDNINPRNVVSALVLELKLEHPGTSYLLIPPREFERTKHSSLLRQCDIFIVMEKSLSQVGLRNLADKFHQPVYIFFLKVKTELRVYR